VPLLASEFFEAAREYPIVFARGEAGPVPAALLGLREAENLYVDNAGKWDARYIPAFVRRYPFVPGKGAQGELLVCIDEASQCFDTKEGEALLWRAAERATGTCDEVPCGVSSGGGFD